MRRALALLLALAFTLLMLGPASGASSDPKPTPVLYIVGDSITAGSYLPAPWRDSYAERTADLLCGTGCPEVHIVGHGGQCLVATGCGYASNLMSTFQAEVLNATPTPTEVLVEIGVNDLGHATDLQMQAAYTQLAAWCAAAGIKFTVGTITPQVPSVYAYWDYWNDQLRQRTNTWLRTTYGASVADFDAVLRLPSADTLDPVYAWSDGLHINPYGTMRMADMTTGLGLN